jgi:hypothetical protein
MIVLSARRTQLDPSWGLRPRDIELELVYGGTVPWFRYRYVVLNGFPDSPTTDIIENLTFLVLNFVPFKQVNAYSLAKSRDVKHFPKNEWGCI